MTDAQKDGEWKGTYRDAENTLWRWTCAKPDVDGEGGNGKGGDKSGGRGGKDKLGDEDYDLPAFSTYNDWLMEWILWVIYLSGELWVFGYPIMIPIGAIIYLWL